MSNSAYKSNLSIDEKLMVTIVRMAEQFKKDSSLIFKNYGLTFPQYNVLRVLNDSENGQNTITSTGNVLLVTGANMTGIAKRLEKNGFLIRKGDPNDERITLLEIAPKGRQTLDNISQEKDENIERYFVDCTEDEKEKLLESIRKLLKK
ncbi:MAG: MarR family transcriptional regulator [Deltaproteobacteria bacterium]|nr:MarR family transcriptional regulator [Deltaproteobacteria bacterium]